MEMAHPFGLPAQSLLRFSSAPGDKETVTVRRRRQGTTGGPEQGRRAEAPARRREGSGGSSGGGSFGGGTGGASGGGGIPGGKGMPIWLVLILLVLYGVYSLISGGAPQAATDDQAPVQEPLEESLPQVEEPQAVRPTVTRAPTRTPAPTKPGSAAARDQTWTVMLYQDADDQILEQDIFLDLNEAERVGSTDQVRVVAQVDRFRGAYQGDGNWTGTRRYLLRQDSNLSRLGSELLDDMGEVNMANGESLVDFVTWAAQAYPADKYVLILSDHGMGWPGGWSDGDSGGKDTRSRLPITSALDDNIYLMELDDALEEARQQAGIDKFELVGMDACLMGHVEVFAALEPHARYAVASQETEPALGWAYSSFLETLVSNPEIDGAELGRRIVDSYIEEDQRIVDEEARAEYLRQGSPLGGLFGPSQLSAGQLANQLSRSITLTTVDLSAMPALTQSLNDLAYALQGEDQSVVASARNYAQSFTNIFSQKGQSPYIDLGHFAQLIQREGRDARSEQAAAEVIDAIQSTIIAEKHGPGKPGSTGISVYFPNSTLYRSPVAGPQSYTGAASRFAGSSLWDDFLAFHYNDVSFQADDTRAVVPESGAPSRAPGGGQIEISPIQLSASSAAPGQPVTLAADISGENIGYIYLFVGFMDQQGRSIYIADVDYLESSDTREVGGVYYPVWPEGREFTLRLEWEPTVFEVTDGSQQVVALLNPGRYGVSPQEAVYTVDGIYTYARDGETRRARLYFRDGALRQVYGFAGEDEAGAPREITPEQGDTFTILEQWLDIDSSGQGTTPASQEGATLTFGADTFRYQEVYAAAGPYVIGMVVEDLDGSQVEAYTQVEVR